jgi:hypothetical protein
VLRAAFACLKSLKAHLLLASGTPHTSTVVHSSINLEILGKKKKRLLQEFASDAVVLYRSRDSSSIDLEILAL